MIPRGLRHITVFVAFYAAMSLQAAAAESVTDLPEHISVPIRWCALRGSPAVEDPPRVMEATTDSVLRARHARATFFVWIPQAGISFRSALTTGLADHVTFPVIDDPLPPKEDGSGGAGLQGDILDPTFDHGKVHEVNAALASCERAWERLEHQSGTNFEGIIGINIRRFVKPDGTPSQLLGIGSSMHTVPHGTDKCAVPPDIADYAPLGSNDGWVIIVDDRFTLESDPLDSVLAHELGHVLFLGHGNGKDDPTGDPPRKNGRYDAFCDRQEDVHATPGTLMKPQRPVEDRLTELQRANARAAARVTVGGMIVRARDLQSGYIISDDEIDKVGDVRDPSVDMRALGINYNTVTGTTVLSYRMVGRLPSKANHRFVLFADMDADPRTGGEPAAIGYQTRFRGAEYVAEVSVRAREGQAQLLVTPTVWQYRPDGFVMLPPDPRIKANVNPVVMANTGKAVHDVVSIQLPHALVSPRPVQVRFQALAERIGGELDRLPEEPDRGLLILLTKPVFPVCRAIPHTVAPGSRFTIEAKGFDPSRKAQVLLDEEILARGSMDGQGKFTAQVRTPEETTDGLHLLVVTESGTAVAAHCTLTVKADISEKNASADLSR